MHRQQPANADSKSQNSDYGSFCNTPCDMNGAAAATAATESSTKGTKSRSAAGEDGSPPATGGSQPDADRKEDEDKVEEDNSVMVSVTCTIVATSSSVLPCMTVSRMRTSASPS
jgi:hypothetical protein